MKPQLPGLQGKENQLPLEAFESAGDVKQVVDKLPNIVQALFYELEGWATAEQDLSEVTYEMVQDHRITLEASASETLDLGEYALFSRTLNKYIRLLTVGTES